MRLYHEQRAELIAASEEQLRAGLQKEGTAPGDELDKLVREKAEKNLDEFEELVLIHRRDTASNWVKDYVVAVSQGLVASAMWTLIVIIFAIILTVNQVDWISLVFGKFTPIPVHAEDQSGSKPRR